MWIEIGVAGSRLKKKRQSQSARTVWIEIGPYRLYMPYPYRHSLRGLCGLKLCVYLQYPNQNGSQSARTVWIEMRMIGDIGMYAVTSQSARTVWIEILP